MNQRFGKKLRFLCIMLTVGALLFTLFAGLTASAASGGKGTKEDPYLLKTAADVQNMQKNLKAHYKLAATIDLSSIKEFQPVGCLGEPFTGSLTCDLGADGLPRYALLNLKVYNHAGEIGNHVFAQAGSGYYTDYDPDGFSHYESGLFGATQGASISNIVILKANIKSTAVGQHEGVWYGAERRMCADQVNAQGTAILVGIANTSTITSCGVQGVIASDSNSTGGLVGKSVGSNISYCWADIDNKTRGFWYSAGLVGNAMDSTVISYSYAKGNIDCTGGKVYGLGNGQCGAGLVSYLSVDSMVSDSYSSVNFSTRSVVVGTFMNANTEVQSGSATNCYSTGVINGVAATTGASSNASNCWALNKAGQFQADFKLGSAADIKAAFNGLKGWNTSGELPTLSNVQYINDYSIFVAGKERAGAGAANNGGNQNSNTNSQNSGTASNTGNGGTTEDPTVSDGQGDVTSDTQNGTEVQPGTTETIVQDGYRNSTTYIVLFICLTAVVICITVASLCLLLKSMEKVKLAKLAAGEDLPEEIFSNSDFDIEE